MRASTVRAPLFVCGVGRSGTSLVQSMLAAHPAVCMLPETHFFRRYVARAGTRRRLERGGVGAFEDRLRFDADFARAGIAPMELVEEALGACDTLAMHQRLLRLVLRREGGERVAEKDPRLIDHLPALHAAYPDAYVIHVLRDPRDVLLSRTKAAWAKGRPWWLEVLVAREQLRRGRQLGETLFGERYLELSYEELLSRPRETLLDLCERTGLAFEEAMLDDFGRSAQRLVDQREMSWKKETLGPLLSDNSGKWREGLTPLQVRLVEGVCVESFGELGYARSDERRALAPRERLAVGLTPVWRGAGRVLSGLRRAMEAA